MKKFRNLTLIGFIASLFLHSVVGLRILFLKPPEPPSAPIEVTIIDNSKSENAKKPRQIVEQSEKRLNDEKDPNAQFLSRFDQRVAKQTRAENTGRFENTNKEGPQKKAQETKNKSQQQQIAEKQPRQQKTKFSGSANGTIPLPRLADLKPQFAWDKVQVGAQNPGPQSATDDHLKELDKGPQTLLSTREFVYYTYYSRIKERLRLFWEPKIREKVRRIVMSGERLPASDDRITKLIIVLDNTGKLIKIQVLGHSGVKDLDDAAVEAFQAAAPFPNPPKGIADSDGTIKIRWDFILEA